MDKTHINICRAIPSHAADIVSLFQNNHKKGYLNKTFASKDKLAEQLSNTNTFIGISAILPNNKLVGFAGIYLRKSGEVTQLYLANFLVDLEFRDQGVGKLVESYRLDICNSIPGKTVAYALIHEDKSTRSITLKKFANFDAWGTRQFFGLLEPGNIGYGNLVLMGRIKGFGDQALAIENVSNVTSSLINKVKSVKRDYVEASNVSEPVLLKGDFGSNPEHGQIYCELTLGANGQKIEEIIRQMKNNDYPYVSIRLDAQIPGLNLIDGILLKNDFYPVVFMPFFSNGHDIIEYQFIKPTQKNELSNYLLNKNELLSCLGKG